MANRNRSSTIGFRIRERRLQCQMTQKELADKADISIKTLSTMENEKKVDLYSLKAVEAFLPPAERFLLPNYSRIWDPRNPNDISGKALLLELAEHEASGKGILFFHLLIPSPLLTPTVQRRLNESLFAEERRHNPERAKWMEKRCNEFQDSRRLQVEQFGGYGVGMMATSGLQCFVNRHPPYDRCEPEEIEECLKHMRRVEGDENSDLRFVLFDDSSASKLVKKRLEGTETMGVIGGSIMMKRLVDFTVIGSHDISLAEETLGELQRAEMTRLATAANQMLEKHFTRRCPR